jgi:hypothetical protein
MLFLAKFAIFSNRGKKCVNWYFWTFLWTKNNFQEGSKKFILEIKKISENFQMRLFLTEIQKISRGCEWNFKIGDKKCRFQRQKMRLSKNDSLGSLKLNITIIKKRNFNIFIYFKTQRFLEMTFDDWLNENIPFKVPCKNKYSWEKLATCFSYFKKHLLQIFKITQHVHLLKSIIFHH